jgi:hypothetical protein
MLIDPQNVGTHVPACKAVVFIPTVEITSGLTKYVTLRDWRVHAARMEYMHITF